MARTAAYRKYQLTFNNPVEHGFSREVIKTTLRSFTSCVYWCICDEISAQPHTHLYVAFKSPVEFTTIQQRFFGAHIEAAKGSHRENRDYIRKEGTWLNNPKHETNLPETFEESGELPPEESRKETQSAAIVQMIQDGATNAEILREYPSALNHQRNMDAARQEFRAEKFRSTFRELDTYYIWGKTGVGKTRFVMDKHGMENVYRVTNYNHPFDGYAGEDVILFDEFRSSLDISDMLKYLDGYPVKLPARYGDKTACFTTAYVISNIPFEAQFPNVQRFEPETWRAFERRFTGGIYELQLGVNLPF